MIRALVLLASLACWPVIADAQRAVRDSPRVGPVDLLTFAPGVVSDDVVIGPADVAEAGESLDPAAPATTTRLLDAVRRAETAVGREEASNGPMSPGLIERLEALAGLYLELGDYPLAIAALDRAMQVTRVHDGLYSPSQLEIMEAMIDAMEEAGAYSESDSLQAEMLGLANRNVDDARSPSILVAVADRQMDAVTDYFADGGWKRSLERVNAAGSGWDLENIEGLRTFSGKKSLNRLDGAIRDVLTGGTYEIGDVLDPRAVLEETYALVAVINDFNEASQRKVAEQGLVFESDDRQRDLALSAFRRARRLYSAALQRMLDSGDYGSGEYLATEQKMIDTYYFELEHTELYPEFSSIGSANPRTLVYGTGTSVLEARVVNLISRGVPAVEIANALMEVGDWHLLFSANGRALEMYQDAYDLLAREDVPVETLSGIVTPATPVVLAQFTAEGSAQFDPARAYAGYLDIAIETGRFGEVKEADVVGRSAGSSTDVEQRARAHVFATRFRPRFGDGRPLRSDAFTLRYYYDTGGAASD